MGALQGSLRAAHLKYHLATVEARTVAGPSPTPQQEDLAFLGSKRPRKARCAKTRICVKAPGMSCRAEFRKRGRRFLGDAPRRAFLICGQASHELIQLVLNIPGNCSELLGDILYVLDLATGLVGGTQYSSDISSGLSAAVRCSGHVQRYFLSR